MKLIIDIPVEEYKDIKDNPSVWSRHFQTIIANGTPYNPTGDLISRSELLKHSYGGDYDGCGGFTREYVYVKDINNAPTVPDRPQGEWKTVEGVDGDEYYECSNCGEPWVLTAGTPKENNMNFCPNCGADMRKGGVDMGGETNDKCE